MYFKLTRFMSGIFFLLASFCEAQRPRNCDQDNHCILLSSCSQMEELVKTGKPSNLEIFRRSICGFVGRKTKVCCPATRLTSKIKFPSFATGNPGQSVSLLPDKCGEPASGVRIINGKPAPAGAYPWMAALGYTEPGNSKVMFECAGSIINKNYVLTAAHCLDPENLNGRRLSVIHLGDHNLATDRDCEQRPYGLICNKPHIVAGIEETVSHPMYNKRAQTSDDIALIRLNTTLNFDSNLATVEPVCIPPNDFNFKAFAGNRAPVAAGWGMTESRVKSEILLHVNVPIAEDASCRERYGERFVGNQLCIGGSEEGFDTCSGDSGGPLVMPGFYGPPYIQIGIVSFGPFPCGLNQIPGVYTNVADYRDWIVDNMRP